MTTSPSSATAANPGYFDLQVNGYQGIDFNVDGLTLEQLHTICEKFVADGAAGMLATIITEEIPLMAERLRTLAQLREQDPFIKEVIQGIHIEGPFFNEATGYRGA